MTEQQTLRQWAAARLDPQPAAVIDALTNDLTEAEGTARILQDSLITFLDMMQGNGIGASSPEAVNKSLQEAGFDSAMIDQMLDQLGWEVIGMLGGGGEDLGRQRQQAVQQAVRLFRYSPLAQWAIWLWTGWGLGDKITVTLKNTEAQVVWDEFAAAERNEPILSADVIHEQSDWLLAKGNRFFVLFTTTAKGDNGVKGKNAGKSTIRLLNQDEIKPIPNPMDKLDTWFYRRTFSSGSISGADEVLYYPDHHTLIGENGTLLEKRWKILLEKKIVRTEDKRADETFDWQVASIYHVAHNRKEEASVWGWPITTTAGAWIKGHKKYSEARLGVAMSVASIVRRSKIKGGSRAVASFIGQINSNLDRNNLLDTNPPPAAGSHAVVNEAVTTKELSMRTGAGDAKADNELFAWMPGLGMGLLPTTMGLDTARWATAVEMDKAQSMIFERYQRFWAAQFRKIVRLVLMLESKYGPMAFTDKDTKAQISTDSFSLSDYPAVSKAVADQVKAMLEPYQGLIPDDTVRLILSTLWTTSADALGLDTADLTSAKAFGVGLEPEPAPPMLPSPDDEPGPEEEAAFIQTLQVALENLEAGDITVDEWAEFMMAEIGEVYKDATQVEPVVQ